MQSPNSHNSGRKPFAWFIWSILLTLSLLSILPLRYFIPPILINSVYYLLAIGWIIPVILVFSNAEIIRKNLRELRITNPIVTWLLTILIFVIVILLWGLIPTAEYSTFMLIFFAFIVAILWVAGNQDGDSKLIGSFIEKSRWANFFLIITAILVTFSAFELTMRWTLIQTHASISNIQTAEWFIRYYNPINELGIRAYEPRIAEENQGSVLVIGDSFAVGTGVKDINDIFTYEMATLLGDDYVVNLHAFPGISPNLELAANYPHQPDILILSHYINDILEEEVTPDIDFLIPDTHPFFLWWSERYFLASYAYWNVYVTDPLKEQYIMDVHSFYEDDDIWFLYAQQLQNFIDWSDENGVTLIVLVWPMLDNLETSEHDNMRVAEFFTAQDIPIVLMSSEVDHLTTRERTVNRFDAHPSPVVHQLAAEALAEVIQTMED